MYNELNKIKKRDLLNPSQKYFGLLVKGLLQNKNINELIQVTSMPVAQVNCEKKLFKKIKEKITDKHTILYPGFVNFTAIKNILVMINSFILSFKILKDKNKRKDTYIICDPLVYDVALSGLLISRLLKIRAIGILTDIPNYMATIEKKEIRNFFKIKNCIKRKLIDLIISGFDGYVFLTEYMNSICNIKNKPYIIIEGLVEAHNIEKNDLLSKREKTKKVVVYAGGLHKKFGIESLIKSAIYLAEKNIEIHLYGEGEYVEKLMQRGELPKNVKYYGLVSLETIIQKETEADLLINPRPSNEEYTKYSFPSKTIEYMSTGTPVLTTKLAGIPKDYYPFLNFIDIETPEGIANAIISILSKPETYLEKQGNDAKKFVIDKKNNIVQGSKLYDLLRKL